MTMFRDRLERHTDSPMTIVATAVGAVLALAALVWVAIAAPRGVPGKAYYELEAQFADTANMTPMTEVRIAGRRVGQVTRIALRDGRGEVRLQLQPDVGPLRTDTRAQIRLRSPLGARYVELIPGTTGRTLPGGATIPVRQTTTLEDVTSVLQAFDAPTRGAAQDTIRGFGAGLLGRGPELNEMLSRLPAVLDDARGVSEAVLARPDAAARLVPSALSAVEAVNPVRAELAGAMRPASRAFAAVADAGADVRATLDRAPATLAALKRGLDAATPLLTQTAGLARETVRLSRPAPRALRRTAALLRDSRPALHDTRVILGQLRGAVPPTLALLRAADPATGPTGRALRNGLPPVRELGGRTCDLTIMTRNWRSMLSFGSAPDSGDPLGGLDDDSGLGQLNYVRLTFAIPPSGDTASLDVTPLAPRANAYPAPCQATKERAR